MKLKELENEITKLIQSKISEGGYCNVTADHDQEMGIWVINVDGSEFSDHPNGYIPCEENK